MTISASVKYFHNGMVGAPIITETVGSLISVLDACLVTGFGTKTATSVTVSGGIATVNIAAGGHSFEQDMVMSVSGATPSALNGEKRVLSTTTTNITFDATGVTDQTATGTITVKVAPLGWDKVYSATNKAVYRSADVLGTRKYLRVDDSVSVNYAEVRGFESMTDVDTGVNQYPTAAQSSLYLWAKSYGAGTQNTAYTIIGDSRTFYFHVHPMNYSGNMGLSGRIWSFGDLNSWKIGDGYASFISAASSTNTYAINNANEGTSLEYIYGSTLAVSAYMCRSALGITPSQGCSKKPEGYYQSDGFGPSHYPAYPNTSDNSLLFTRCLVWEAGYIRGQLRGVNYPAQSINGLFKWKDKLDGTGDLVGRKLFCINAGSSQGAVIQCPLFFDIYGPW